MLNGDRLGSLEINGPDTGLRTFVQSKWTVSTDLITNKAATTKIVATNVEVNTEFTAAQYFSFNGSDAPTYRTFITFTNPVKSTQLEYAG